MTSKNLFKKKTLDDESDESQEAASEKSGSSTGGNKTKKKDSTAKNATTCVDDDEGTIRLSCDLQRSSHTTLRVCAALSQHSILGMIEVLIAEHLQDRPQDEIVARYRKRGGTKNTRIK